MAGGRGEANPPCRPGLAGLGPLAEAPVTRAGVGPGRIIMVRNNVMTTSLVVVLTVPVLLYLNLYSSLICG